MTTRLAHKIDEIFKPSKNQFVAYTQFINKGNELEGQADLHKCVSLLDNRILSEKVETLSALELTNFQCGNDFIPEFMVEPLQRLHLGISKKLKGCNMVYMLELDKDSFALTNKRGKVPFFKSNLQNECDTLLSAYLK